MISLGIDVGGGSVKLAAVQDGRLLWNAQSTSYSRPTKSQLVDAIRAAFNGRRDRFDVAGICAPGKLNRARRMITLSVNVPSLMGIVLDDLVADAVGDSVGGIEILNDSTASAYDIYASNNLTGRLLSITLGTGVVASVLDNGVPVFLDGES